MKTDKLQVLMKNIDTTPKPKHWRKFLKENTKHHNLILKYGNTAFCTHCQKYFDENVVVHPYKKSKCKWCGKEYYVRNHNIKNYTFIDDVAFYVKTNNTIALRVFEVESNFDYKTRKFKKDIQEYLRFIPNIGIIINNTVSFYMWNRKVWHNIKIRKWHIYKGNKTLCEMPIYPYDKELLFKGTHLEYAPIKEFKEEYNYFNEFEVLQFANYQSFELLWKMGLHRLALDAKHFNKKGSFSKRFGLPKSFLSFMVENNIDYENYRILKLLQVPDMKLINKYRKYDYNYLAFMDKQGLLKNLDIVEKFYSASSALRTIAKYVPLRKFIHYEKGVKNIYLYMDYLVLADKLNFNIKSKKRLFPYQLKGWHNKLSKKLDIIEDMNTKFATYLRYLELSKYTYSDNKYIIFPAPSTEYIIDEGKQQNNCVARLYLQPYIEGETELFFIRDLNNPTQSLVTLEYKNGKVSQKSQKNNSNTTKKQDEFVKKWVMYRNFLDEKEKYKDKKQIKFKRYDIIKMVA